MMDVDAPRIVVEQVTPSTRYYHVNVEFGCEIEHVITQERFQQSMQQANPQSPEELMAAMQSFMQENPLSCSLGQALNELKYCRHQHMGALGVIEVMINLAIADWSIVHKQVLEIIQKNLAWGDEMIDLRMVQ